MNRLVDLRVPVRLACALFAGCAVTAHAGVYKCAGENGAVVYQDAACAPGRQLRNLELDPAQLSVVPGNPVPQRVERPEPVAKREKVRTVATRARGGDPAERKFLRTGMTAAEVVARVGKPDMQSSGGHKEGQHWSYLPVAGDADTMTTVTFAGGAVSRVERKVVR